MHRRVVIHGPRPYFHPIFHWLVENPVPFLVPVLVPVSVPVPVQPKRPSSRESERSVAMRSRSVSCGSNYSMKSVRSMRPPKPKGNGKAPRGVFGKLLEALTTMVSFER